MKVNANTLKVGNIIEHKKRLWNVVKVEHIKPGKGGAFAQVELKCLKEGTKLNERFRSAESVEKARLHEEKFQFLYQEQDCFYVMNASDYEQMQLPIKLLDDKTPYLQEEMEISVCFYNDEIVSIKIPDQVILTVQATEPVIKGQTATASYKPATLSNGIKTSIPQHINDGDKIVISTIDNTYVEKAK